eukprot:scaffold267920_cov51-Prasinocladus_malaysianus.AAC.1
MFGCGRSAGSETFPPGRTVPAVRPGKDVLLNSELCVVFHDFINIDLFSQGLVPGLRSADVSVSPNPVRFARIFMSSLPHDKLEMPKPFTSFHS